MISLILYGRNDNYGYNLQKRAGISLNCMAEVLTAPGDEIIFVDYNTPDDFPTFPEAIADTLTQRAKALLRILRVRPSQHERFRRRTKLLALEPIARNVAVRRSNPDNRWILSTNTDMVFVPRRDASLSEIAAALPDAYYHLPRFEVPEPLWEGLDRLNPAGIIDIMRTWGCAFHLNEIAFSTSDVTKYDGPGDFQLMLRSDIWRVHGFHESMLLGWHVDSNIAKRLSLLPQRMGDLVNDLFGYHCDHTRQLTLAHKPRGEQNDSTTFFFDVKSADVPEQAESWGLADEYVEELRVDSMSRAYVEGLRSTIAEPLTQPSQLRYSGKTYYPLDYSVDHVIPFLAGIFSSYPRNSVIGWFGTKRLFLKRFAAMWQSMGFVEPILVFTGARWLGPDLPSGCSWADDHVLDERCQAFVFDFGKPDTEEPSTWDSESDPRINDIACAFLRMAQLERRHLSLEVGSPRRFINVNPLINLKIAAMVNDNVVAALAPRATRIRQGFVTSSRDPKEALKYGLFDCMPAMVVGPAGFVGPAPRRDYDRAIHANPGLPGFVAYGPYIALPPGSYEATFEIYAERTSRAKFRIEVAKDMGKSVVVQRHIKPHWPLRRHGQTVEQTPRHLTFKLEFETSGSRQGDEALFEFRVWSPGTITFCLVALSVRQIAAYDPVSEETAVAGERIVRSP